MSNGQPVISQTNTDPRIDLAIQRTQLAVERTQLAWVRTVLGLITGGIAIDKGAAALHEARINAGTALVKTGHLAGLLLTSVGTLLMIIATIIFFRRLRQLNQSQGVKNKIPSPASMLCLFTCFIGMLAIWFLRNA